MIYGQLQYYNNELKAWFRIIDFHKRELHELLTQLNVLLSFPLVSLPDAKAANALIDELMIQERRFDHARNHFAQQVERLEHAITYDKLDPSVAGRQENCRAKMKTYEVTFIKSRYDCFVFLSIFFNAALKSC